MINKTTFKKIFLLTFFIFLLIISYSKYTNLNNSIDIATLSIDSSGSTDVTNDIENIMKYAAKNNKLLIISKGTYAVSNLKLPSNLKIKCSPKATFKLIDNAPEDTRCFTITSASNVSISGRLNIDGNSSNQQNKSEHMHGLFIYNSNNVNIESVNSYNAVGDNVSISGGSDKSNDYSYNINIKHINAKKAGRKNLVLEHVTNLKINSAYLDNIEGGEDGNGGNSLDVEPFNYHGNMVMKNTIDKLYTIGCGNDFSAGTDELSNKYIINIGEFTAKVLDLPCLVDANAQFNKSAIFSYGITLNIEKMYVTLASTVTKLNDRSYTEAPNVINACHKANININYLEVNGGVKNKPIFITTMGYTHYPEIKINHLTVNGKSTSFEGLIE